MNKFLLLFLLLMIWQAAPAQVIISDQRPTSPITLKPNPVSVDTVYIVLQDRVVTGIRQEITFECIYDQKKEHEGNTFEGQYTFLAPDKSGAFTVKVVPLAYRVKEPVLDNPRALSPGSGISLSPGIIHN